VVLPSLRWLPRLIEALQAPENVAGEFLYPTTISVLVDLILVVFIENATNKQPVTIVRGDKYVNEINSFGISFALGLLKPDNRFFIGNRV
jgi:hypothetical protein